MTEPALSAAGCLSLLWPAIPDSMADAATRARIDALAATLPPVPRIALELRLSGGSGRADLHQLVLPTVGDAAALSGAIDGAATKALSSPALRAFLRRWAADGGLRATTDGLYLEWDAPRRDGAPPAPALFLPLADRRLDSRAGARRAALLAEAEALRAGSGPSLAATLAFVEGRLPDGVTVSFVGFMIGRGEAVRLNLRGLQPRDFADVLARIGWPGDIAVAGAHFDRLVRMADRVVVALDLAPDLEATIGFEIVIDADPANDPRWDALFAHLAAADLCASAHAEALRAMPARLLPEAADVAWPASWIAATLRGPPDALPWVDRRVSHLKLGLGASGVAEAKAYVSAQHFWHRTEPPPRLRAPCAGETVGLDAAREGAVAFLLAERAQDGLWRDFPSGMGPSDEWISGFVGTALAGRRDAPVTDALADVRAALIERQRAVGGWGYNASAEPDADSTAWVLRLFEATGGDAAGIERANAFLAAHHLPCGGVSTYAPATSLAFAGDFEDEAGWRRDHVCVAANVAWRRRPDLLAYLLEKQEPDGRWAAYWWQSDSFSTGMAVAALADDADAAAAIAHAVQWAGAAAQRSSQAFERAWLAMILLHGDAGARAQARELGRLLTRSQLDDGSWPGTAALLFPSPNRMERLPDATPAFDRRRVFTTASVLTALDALAA